MSTNTLLILGAVGVGLYFLLRPKPAAAAAPTAGTPGQTSVGNPMMSLLLGLAAGYVGTQAAQAR